ncbi:hypothetical protein [Actinocrispum wychmicini]|uniref:Uncharacterized protein n=1 Tax=Actinocrispum wychmicini TaxID=1213861 RepID=A0A4R2J5N9_9PSEU|nr:hypothetical protein [Actinocrispum wychmicini]TCO53664.1 hypothetical protein EV192_110253 [Actinocrispum wychmicini]
MDPEWSTLAETAASALVKRLATDGWEKVVAAVGALWRRVHPDRADTVRAEAAETRENLVAARGTGGESVEEDLVGEWRSRLRRLVAADPGVVDELRHLVAEWSPAENRGGYTEIGQLTMRANASGHSRVTMAGRDAHVVK